MFNIYIKRIQTAGQSPKRVSKNMPQFLSELVSKRMSEHYIKQKSPKEPQLRRSKVTGSFLQSKLNSLVWLKPNQNISKLQLVESKQTKAGLIQLYKFHCFTIYAADLAIE